MRGPGIRGCSGRGDIVDFLKRTKRPRLPEKIERRERESQNLGQVEEDEIPPAIKRLRKLRSIQYREVIELTKFINEKTPFATKHGVKGAEFENVLVVIGRGWNQYNFNQFLEWVTVGVPSDKQETFERNRNLFYVACSRPKKRLAILFTQKLSDKALTTLTNWVGKEAISSISISA